MLEQSKDVRLTVIELMPQASDEPLSRSEAFNTAEPFSKLSSTFFTRATGEILSSTVTIADAVELLSLLSVTVNVTMFVLTFEQSKSVLDNWIDFIPHTSYDPLLIAVASINAFPSAFSCTVTF